MRDLQRNKRNLWYANVSSEAPILDEFGNDTGETEYVYQDPVQVKYNVSTATGGAVAEAFGAFTDYSRVISTSDIKAPFKVGTHVWFGVDPEESEYNYVVVKVADALNSVLFALKEVVTG